MSTLYIVSIGKKRVFFHTKTMFTEVTIFGEKK